MWVYLIVVFAIFVLMFFEKVSFDYRKKNLKKFNKNGFFFAACTILFIFSAFRYDVGWDYWAYYNTIKNDYVTNIISRNEYLTIFLVDLSKFIGITNIYFFINSLILMICIYLVIVKYSNNKWMSLIVFVTFPLFYLNSFSVIRIFTAIAITFYAFKYIMENKFWKYIFFVYIASLFHQTALIAILFYFIKYIKVKRSWVLFLVFISPFMGVILENIVNLYFPEYSVYLNETDSIEGTKAILVFLLMGILGFIYWDKLVYKDFSMEVMLKIFYFSLFIYIVFLENGTIGHRFSLYGTIFFILILPKFMSLIKKDEQFTLNLIIYPVFILFYIYIIYTGAVTYLPYDTIFNF
ncbi:EpsG family protein [Solibacillus sp. FSL W7-1436]|uniref:EpsG family protein n=1 Tax=Solibacillus sp. FSL W7-1436 TaxID=2921705 RepID=UPI0030FBFAF3